MNSFKRSFVIGLATVVLSGALVAMATEPEEGKDNELSKFRAVHGTAEFDIPLPKKATIFIPEIQDFGVAVVEDNSGEVQAYKMERRISEAVRLRASGSSALRGNLEALTDDSLKTEAEFDVDADGGEAWVTLEGGRINSDRIFLHFGNYTKWPKEYSVEAMVDGNWKTVVAQTKFVSPELRFPATSSDKWRIGFMHQQPLVVREISLQDANFEKFKLGENLTWLARPGESYSIYFDAAAEVKIETPEAGDLDQDENTIDLFEALANENSLFVEPDSDEDGVADFKDNCIKYANEDQSDLDENGLGDACEDHDGDGIKNGEDNCPDHANRAQADEDEDGIGDECDDRENRLTERNPWLPWVTIGLVALIVAAILFHTWMKEDKKKKKK